MTKTRLRGLRTALVLPVLALTALLAACSGGTADEAGDSPATTSTRTVGTTPTMEKAPTGTTGTETSATPSDEDDDRRWGIATVELGTGEVATLYEGADTFRPRLGWAFAPWPEANNNRIWLSPTPDEAVHYSLDGTVEERLDGWGVLESQDGQSRSYFATGDDGAVTIVSERGENGSVEIPVANVSNRTFSPNGRWLAWLDATDADANLIMMMDLNTLDVQEVAEFVRCSCDTYHYIEWSPSSRYLAYENPDYDDPSVRGVYIKDIQSAVDGNERDPIRLADATPVVDGWLEADETEFLLILDDRVPTLHSVDEEAEPVVITVDGSSPSVTAGTLQGLVTVSLGSGTEAATLIFDPVSGERVRELRGVSDSVLTSDGIATAAITRNDIACTGVEVDHPAFEETLDCTAEYLRWSPDGRYLALIPQAQSAPIDVLDVTTGEITELPHAGPPGIVPEWSEDGRYLIWVWGVRL